MPRRNSAVSLQLFGKPRGFSVRRMSIREIWSAARRRRRWRAWRASSRKRPPAGHSASVGMFDAANGSVRQAVLDYAVGRNDPQGPLGSKEIFREHGSLLRLRPTTLSLPSWWRRRRMVPGARSLLRVIGNSRQEFLFSGQDFHCRPFVRSSEFDVRRSNEKSQCERRTPNVEL